MEYCIIMCRSLTYAQRAQSLLQRENIRVRVVKAPQGVTPEGCSYGVKLALANMYKAKAYMSMYGISTGRVYRLDAAGKAEEVEL